MSKSAASLAIASAVLTLFFVATSAFAINIPERDKDKEKVSIRAVERVREATSEVKRDKDLNRTKVCQVKESVIKNRLAGLLKFTANMTDKFSQIATRTEEFYTNKVLPKGQTVPNYDSLVSDIQTKKAAVATLSGTVSQDVNSFSCTATDTKTQLSKFNADMKAVKAALKNYRTSVRNLIVAVHSVTGSENRDKDGSPSAKERQLKITRPQDSTAGGDR